MAEPALTAELVYFLCNVWSIRHWTVGRFEPARLTPAAVVQPGGLVVYPGT